MVVVPESNDGDMGQQRHITAVGVGPGDPDLMTLKGLRAIDSADIIFVPRKRDGEDSLSLQIARPWIDETRQQIVELTLPMVRHSEQTQEAYRVAAAQIHEHLQAHGQNTPRDVHGVYLILGDPLLYGTFIYIWQELQQNYPDIKVSVVPGVTSFAAAAAVAHIPMAAGREQVAIVPADYDTIDQLCELFSQFDTVVLLKVGKVLPQLLTALDNLGVLESTTYIEHVGMEEERVLALGGYSHETQLTRDAVVKWLSTTPRPYLALLIVRRDARLREAKR